MSRPEFGQPAYGLTRRFERLGFDAAIAAIKAELQKEGFGVLTEIDIQATLKAKLGADHRPYVILGSCHPPTANQAINAEPGVGLLLPCNVVVSEDGDGKIVISAIDPVRMLSILEREDVLPLAQGVKASLQAALDRVQDRD